MVILGLIIQILFAVFFIYLCLAFITGAPFVPSAHNTADAMIRLAEIKPGENIIDLGSGDGRLVRLAAKKGANATGLEINPFLVIYSTLFSSLFRYSGSVRFISSNFWTSPLNGADVVFVYLLPWKMKRLEDKLLHELAPGARVVSNSFIFPHLPLIRSDKQTHVFVFKIPKK